MKLTLYKQIQMDISKFVGLSRECAEMLIKKYPYVPPESLHSILSIEVMNRVKANKWKFDQNPDLILAQFEASRKNNEPAGIIVRLAASMNFPPTMIARLILHKYSAMSDKKVSKCDISRCLKNSTLIEDQNLAYEVYLASLYDDRDGFISDTFARAIGVEYEVKLQELLQKHQIAFSTEDDLRDRGYDKTPDIKLEIPIAVDGFVINWIESKARFGSPYIHSVNLKTQLLSYWNRFGPGLIIYWFDFVDSIIEPNEKRFLVLNHFPDNIVHMKLDEL